MFYLIPLERYTERHTYQLDHWQIAGLTRLGVPHKSIYIPNEVQHIGSGQVLDGIRRGKFAMRQCEQILRMIDHDVFREDDVLFFNDFFHPGLEAIMYAFEVTGKPRPRMVSFCWAQSVDQYDFTANMGNWMRRVEQAYAAIYDRIYMANSQLKSLFDKEVGIGEKRFRDRSTPTSNKTKVVGLPYDSESVKAEYSRIYGGSAIPTTREIDVVYSSRLDLEKCPEIFFRLVEKMPNVQFAICTSQPEFRSNRPEILERLQEVSKLPNLRVITGLSKPGYYRVLSQSKIQFNCALQDWVSYTLLEATTFGCHPVYPNFRSFPETFISHRSSLEFNNKIYQYDKADYLYRYRPNAPLFGHYRGAVDSAEKLIARILKEYKDPPNLDWVYGRFDNTMARICEDLDLLIDQSYDPLLY
jgi:hypothetical protein